MGCQNEADTIVVHAVEEVVKIVRTILQGMEIVHNDEHFLGINLPFVQVCYCEDVFFVFFEIIVDVAFECTDDFPTFQYVDTTFEVATLEQQTGQLGYKGSLSTSLIAINIDVTRFRLRQIL